MKYLLLLMSFGIYANCIEMRAGIDIGSGASKLKIAKVDKCKDKIEKILFTKDFAVEYKDDLRSRNKKSFSKSIIKKGRSAFREISSILKKYKVQSTRAVATSAFRTSSNSAVLIRYAKSLDIPVEVISQDEEAILGYKSAKSLTSGRKYLVWDIGGGSMQMSYKKDDKLLIYKGKLASVPFRAYVTKFVQNSKKRSPNPMSSKDVDKSIKYAHDYALRDIDKDLQKVIKTQDIDIIGIGGVHSSAILESMGKKGNYTYKELESFLKARKSLTDKEIGGKYASTSTSNLALVLGYMKALGIKKVIGEKLNLSDGLLYNK